MLIRGLIGVTMCLGLSGCPNLRTSTSTAERNRRASEQTPETTAPTVAEPTTAQTAETPPAAPETPHVVEALTVDLGNGQHLDMVLIPAGEFIMGTDDPDADDDEMPAHDVQITKSFYMSRTEISQAQWGALMSGHGSQPRADDLPVNNVSFEFASHYCQVATNATGHKFRLPSEAEWEYACRAGSGAAYGFGDDVAELERYAWFEDNSNNQPQPVGTRLPNRFGLFDMHGNVAEWCNDWYDSAFYDSISMIDPKGPESGSSRVIRGGSWYLGSWPCRSAYRSKSAPTKKSPLVGFRVVMDAE